jgi:hypothetical protein
MERWQSWSIASDLKSDEVQASVGSNPTFSVSVTKQKPTALLFVYFFKPSIIPRQINPITWPTTDVSVKRTPLLKR